MMGFSFLLAQLDATQELLNQRSKQWGGFERTDTLMVLAFIFLLVAALFSWAYFIRKRPSDQHGSHALVRPRRSHRSRHARSSYDDDESARRVRVRRRRRRRDTDEHLPRNPTLGETGGLPPPRPEEPEEPPAVQSPG